MVGDEGKPREGLRVVRFGTLKSPAKNDGGRLTALEGALKIKIEV
jgi:hypothetical protein